MFPQVRVTHLTLSRHILACELRIKATIESNQHNKKSHFMEKTDKDNKNESDKGKPLHEEDYGYYFYPARKMGEGRLKEHTFWDDVKKGWFAADHSRCTVNVMKCAKFGKTIVLFH